MLTQDEIAQLRKFKFVRVKSQFAEHWLPRPIMGEPLTEQAKFVFVSGQCHAFAIAIHKLTGWQIVADEDFLGRAKGHILVRMPDGKGVIDATDEVLEDHASFQVITREDLMRAYKNGYREWIYPNVRAALPFAKARLAVLK